MEIEKREGEKAENYSTTGSVVQKITRAILKYNYASGSMTISTRCAIL